jgi:hypothetical protein
MSILRGRSLIFFSLLWLTFIPTLQVLAQIDNIGTGASLETEVQSIGPVITERGKISISVDGVGTLADNGTVQVEKPAGATVRRAYMAAASTGLSNFQIPFGGLSLNGQPVSWTTIVNSSIASWNYWGDVTSIVSTIVDAAPAGRVNLTVSEGNSNNIDGSALIVIFDDPNQLTENTIILLFGAQDVRGDTFSILLADPIDKSDPFLSVEFGMAISFGCQGNCGSQYSQIDVNNNRLTTSAGGYDDGERANGALLTVGGLDDSPANPPDPFRIGGGDSRDDDELYDLLPYVADQSTAILVSTLNPSNDDNIFFAYLVLDSVTAVVNESVILSPTMGQACHTNGSEHLLTAVAQDNTGMPLVDVDVTFEVLSGPNQGVLGSDRTDNNGIATLSYTGTSAGTDKVIAHFLNSNNETITSNQVNVLWDCAVEPPDPIPEPATMILMGSGLAALGAYVRRRRQEEKMD